MTTREKKLLYLTAMSYTQKVLNTVQATKLLEKRFPNGIIKYKTLEGFNVVLCESYDKQTGMCVAGEYIVTDEKQEKEAVLNIMFQYASYFLNYNQII